MEVRVRFAPSPTGIPHVGSIRTVLFNYFFAKKAGGKFILRIEDTDQARKIEGAAEAIKESLLWLGIEWDEYFLQSERVSEYKKWGDQLASNGFAREEAGAVRFTVPKDGSTSWIDAVGNKKIEFKNSEIEDFIILKSDGFPTYHLANVIDDHLMNITHVIRGDDWIPSAPKHLMLYKAFGWTPPIFAHVPNVLGTDHRKLSKRRGAKSVLDFKAEGLLPEALLNYLMLLGFSPKDDREILSREDFEKEFELSKINTAPAIFDEKKLLWMNGEYIRKMDIAKLKDRLLEFDPSISRIPNVEQYIPLAQSRMKTLSEFGELVRNNERVSLTEEQNTLAKKLKEKYLDLKPWDSTHISGVTISVRDELGTSTKDVYTVLTGKPQGLPFEQKVEIQGQQGTISWLNKITS